LAKGATTLARTHIIIVFILAPAGI
jgi:hypothetical protein